MKKTDFILDCSVTMAWCFLEESSAYTSGIKKLFLTNSAKVPRLWRIEVANVLWVGEKKKRISRPQSEKFISLLSELPIIVDTNNTQRSMTNTLNLARDQDLSAYDATYLDLALRENLPIATLDKKLQKCAKYIGIELV